MLKNIDERIFTFRAHNLEYYITKGKSPRSTNRYYLTRVSYPSFTIVKLRIFTTMMGSFKELDEAARVALAERLISEQLLKDSQRSREPPSPRPTAPE